MTREQLEKMNKQELKTICEENSIPHYHGKNIFRKGEMVDAIVKSMERRDDITDTEKKIEESGDTSNQQYRYDNESKMDRVVTAPIGTLIAFYEPGTTKLNTAKITNRNKSKKLIKCETQYGKEFVISFENVVWVKTGSRWPKGIYQVLKGSKVNEERKEKQC